MPALLDIILELTHAERGFLMLYDKHGELTIQSARSSSKSDLDPETFQGSTSIVRNVVQEKKPLYVPVLPISKDFSEKPSVRANNLQSVICFPLWHNAPERTLMGVLYIDSSSPKPAPLLQENEISLMEGLANHVAIAIENAQLFQQIESLNQQ